jgi:hypothetical protein
VGGGDAFCAQLLACYYKKATSHLHPKSNDHNEQVNLFYLAQKLNSKDKGSDDDVGCLSLTKIFYFILFLIFGSSISRCLPCSWTSPQPKKKIKKLKLKKKT